MQLKRTTLVFLTAGTLMSCANDPSNDDSNTDGLTLTATASGSGTEEDAGDGGCTPGTPYCECFEGMCFEGLLCNDDDHCVPDAGTPTETGTTGTTGGPECTPGTLDCECDPNGACDAGLMPDLSTGTCICLEEGLVDECQLASDCPLGEICYMGTPTWCGSPEWVDWSVAISDYDIACDDGVGSCELLFYKYRWDWDAAEWVEQNFDQISGMTSSDFLDVEVWESDAFSDDYINTFQFSTLDGVEAWKTGSVLTVAGDLTSDSMDLVFQPL